MKNTYKVMLVLMAFILLFHRYSMEVTAAGVGEGGQTLHTSREFTITRYDSNTGTTFTDYKFESVSGVDIFAFYDTSYTYHNQVLDGDTTGRIYVYACPAMQGRSAYTFYVNGEYNNDSYAGQQSVSGKTLYVFWQTNIDAHTFYNANGRIQTGSVSIPYMSVSSQNEALAIMSEYYEGKKEAYNPDMNLPDVDLEVEGIYLDDIPAPKLYFPSKDGMFFVSNAVDGWNIEIQGRWWTVDDIELYKQGVKWYYKYYTEYKSNLSAWVSYADNLSSTGSHNLVLLGKESADDLLEMYPISERTIYGGTNILGNYFSGYDTAVAAVKVWIGTPYSPYFCPEMYVRFYYEEDGVVYYGRWSHWYQNLASQGITSDTVDSKVNQSEEGLTPSQKDALENSGHSNWLDTDATIDGSYAGGNLNSGTDFSNAMDSFLNILDGMYQSVGRVIPMLTDFFGWLPWWVVSSIGAFIVVCFILRILGR